jgi:hypothetical protein
MSTNPKIVLILSLFVLMALPFIRSVFKSAHAEPTAGQKAQLEELNKKFPLEICPVCAG